MRQLISDRLLTFMYLVSSNTYYIYQIYLKYLLHILSQSDTMSETGECPPLTGQTRDFERLRVRRFAFHRIEIRLIRRMSITDHYQSRSMSH